MATARDLTTAFHDSIYRSMPPAYKYFGINIFTFCGTGKSLRDGIKGRIGCDFTFPHIKVIFPTAPLMPYTLRQGKPGNVWFDRATLEPDGVEYLSSIDEMAADLSVMIQAEVDAGIPRNRILLVGFSMGASMVLHLGLRFEQQVAGIVSMSTFLYRESKVFQMLETECIGETSFPPIFCCHGDNDELVDHAWGRETGDRLERLGLKDITFHTIPALQHTVNKPELELVKSWAMKRLPRQTNLK